MEAKKTNTSILLRKIKNTRNLTKLLKSNQDMADLPPFHRYISSLLKERGGVAEQVIRRAAIERTYGHQLFNGTRSPSRDKAIQLAFGFGLDFEDTQKLLQAAQKSPLYPKIKRDAAIIFCIHHGRDIFETQEILQALELPMLGSTAL